jgi:hypothetical protein
VEVATSPQATRSAHVAVATSPYVPPPSAAVRRVHADVATSPYVPPPSAAVRRVHADVATSPYAAAVASPTTVPAAIDLQAAASSPPSDDDAGEATEALEALTSRAGSLLEGLREARRSSCDGSGGVEIEEDEEDSTGSVTASVRAGLRTTGLGHSAPSTSTYTPPLAAMSGGVRISPRAPTGDRPRPSHTRLVSQTAAVLSALEERSENQKARDAAGINSPAEGAGSSSDAPLLRPTPRPFDERALGARVQTALLRVAVVVLAVSALAECVALASESKQHQVVLGAWVSRWAARWEHASTFAGRWAASLANGTYARAGGEWRTMEHWLSCLYAAALALMPEALRGALLAVWAWFVATCASAHSAVSSALRSVGSECYALVEFEVRALWHCGGVARSAVSAVLRAGGADPGAHV